MCSNFLDLFPIKTVDSNPKNYAETAYKALNLFETENYQNYIDRYNILNLKNQKSMKLLENELNDEIIGCLQIFKGNIWGIGVLKQFRNEEILNKVVDKILNFKIDTLYVPDYLAQLILEREKKFSIVYNRFCLRLYVEKFNDESTLNGNLNFYNINIKDNLDKLKYIYLNSFKGSIDENLGLFNSRRVNEYLKAVINGEFGKFFSQCSWMNDYSAILVTKINEKTAFIPILGVIKPEQNRKIGYQLIKKAIISCKENHIDKITLWVTEENSSAMKLYSKLGFSKTDVNEVKLSKRKFWL